MELPAFNLGAWRPLDGSANAQPFRLPAHHLVTHGVITGMTGSGKTGLVTVIEEALRAKVPVLVIDVKGDLPNLLLTFPSFAAFFAELLIEIGHRPAAELEALARILGRPAGRLHDAIHGNLGADDNLPHGSLSLFEPRTQLRDHER